MTPPLVERLPDFCSLLLLGPPGVGKFDFLMGALRAYLEREHPVLFVCVDVSPDEILAHARRSGWDLKPYRGKTLLFVDCYTPSFSDQTVTESEGVLLVSSLSNLEGIGMALTKAAAQLGSPVKILFYTISTLFLYNSPQSLSKFYQIVAARVKSQLGLVLFACQQGVNEERQERLLQSLVDGMVELRFDEEMAPEVRLHHLRGHRVDSRWEPLAREAPSGENPPLTVDARGKGA